MMRKERPAIHILQTAPGYTDERAAVDYRRSVMAEVQLTVMGQQLSVPPHIILEARHWGVHVVRMRLTHAGAFTSAILVDAIRVFWVLIEIWERPVSTEAPGASGAGGRTAAHSGYMRKSGRRAIPLMLKKIPFACAERFLFLLRKE